MSLHQHSEVILAINFPNSPSNGDTYTEGTVQWQYSSTNNAWTMITTGTVGIDNGVNHDQEVIFLDRNVSNQNIPTAGVGFTYNPTTRKIGIKANVSQANNLFEITDSSDVILNSINERGILSKAGRIFFQGSVPTANAADTGQLWYNTGSNTLSIWNGTAWVSAGGGVDISSAQVITGAKSFSAPITLGSSSALAGETSLVFKPTNTTALTLSTAAATFTVPVDFSAVGSNVKTALVTVSDNMTVDGVKTFTNTLNLSSGLLMNSVSGTSRIFCTSSTSPGVETNNLLIQPSQSSTGRYIQINTNSNTLDSQGITIRSKNENNQGDLNIVGNTKITGNLQVTGSFTSSANAVNFGAISYGSFKSQSGTLTGNKNTVPQQLGPLTFTQTLDTVSWTTSTTNVTNNSSNPVSFYYRREQVKGDDIYTYGIHKFTLSANKTINIPFTNIDGMSADWHTKTLICSNSVALQLAGQTDRPILVSFTLCPT